jgi:protein TonB
VKPLYPSDAKAAGIQGGVILEVVIGKEGDVQGIRVVSGHPMLRQAAIDAISRWKYRPTLLNGEPIEVVDTVTINFSFQP